MEIKKINILNNTVESMMSDADDKGEETFGITLTLEDARTICKALNLLEKDIIPNPAEEIEYESPFRHTVEYMLSPNYKDRFNAEYQQTKIRYERLKAFNTIIKAASLTSHKGALGVEMPKHDCPEALLREQQSVMGQYLHILELRAVIEDVDLR